ncbi:MAG: hypothetical protein ABIA76_00805 [Candidatus Diapherotrites archaeon]
MPNITLSATDEMKERMGRHPEVRWSNAVRIIIEKKLNDFEKAERLANKINLSEKDVEFISDKVEKDMAKHAKELLNEGYS